MSEIFIKPVRGQIQRLPQYGAHFITAPLKRSAPPRQMSASAPPQPPATVHAMALSALNNPNTIESPSAQNGNSAFLTNAMKRISERLLTEVIGSRTATARSLQELQRHYHKTSDDENLHRFSEKVRREAFALNNAFETGVNDNTHIYRLASLIARLKGYVTGSDITDPHESDRYQLTSNFLTKLETDFRDALKRDQTFLSAQGGGKTLYAQYQTGNLTDPDNASKEDLPV